MIKKTYQKKFLLVVAFIFSISIHAQYDVILKNNGDEMQGKVVKINKNNLQFVYKNETVEYTIDKLEITKITFGSGRIQFFKKAITSNFFNKKIFDTDSKLEKFYNKVAILPFGYIEGDDTSNVIMTRKIQQETFLIFKKKASILKFQNPNTTNSLLAKAGVNNNNIQGYSMGEICNVLNVEYVIQGLVSIEKPTVAEEIVNDTVAKSTINKVYLDKKAHIVGDIWNNITKTNTNDSIRISTDNYPTNITMNVYNDKGQNVFSKEHTSFWQPQNAYKITLTYLAKQTPIYKR